MSQAGAMRAQAPGVFPCAAYSPAHRPTGTLAGMKPPVTEIPALPPPSWLVATWLVVAAPLASAAGDPSGQHHAPFTQINTVNVTKLAPAWTHRNGDMAAAKGEPSSVSAQSTLILLPPEVGGHLVYCTPFNCVIALDANDGKPCGGFGEGVVVTLVERERFGLEEVGLLEHFLPELCAQRNDKNLYRLSPQ
jgi:hypothetical protein